MKIKANFSDADIRNAIEQRMQAYEQAAINRLIRVGERFVTHARLTGNYTDRTGNLRSSIGYLVMKDGQQLTQGGFEVIKEGAEGAKEGEAFLQEVAAKYPKGICLICVAGKSYAGYVEAKGFSVITGSAIEATTLLKESMEQLGAKF